MLSVVSCLAVAVVMLSPIASAQRATDGDWQRATTVSCRGGTFVAGSFSGDSNRLLTGGEKGDLILWDVRAGSIMRSYPSLGGRVAMIRQHPRDPWAIVVTGWSEGQQVHQLDLASGRHRRLWQRELKDVAFNQAGTQVACLLEHEAGRGRSRLLVYRDATVLAGSLDLPELTRELDDFQHVFFAPDGESVMLTCRWGQRSRRVPLHGGRPIETAEKLIGFTPSGDPVTAADGMDDPAQICGAWSVSWRDGLQRCGPSSSELQLPGARWDYHVPIIAADGTVAIADRKGLLHLFGPAPGRKLELIGHLSDPLQLVFSLDGGTLAIVGRRAATFVRSSDGSTLEVDGACSVQSRGASGFVLLRGNTVSDYDAGTRTVGPPLITWTAPATAVLSRFHWTETFDWAPFAWVEPRRSSWDGAARMGRLWFVGDDGPSTTGVRMMMGAGAIVQLDFSVTDRETDVFHHLAPSAFAAVAAECILTAEKTFPIQCGTGLQDVRFWGAVRLFDKDGALLRRRFLSNGVERLRVSPKGRRAVLLPQLIVIDTKSLATIGERRVATSWVDLGFVDERNALATDGRRLVSMTIPGLRETALDPLAGVSRIDALALSPGATLLAVSDGGEVGLFRRVQSRR